MHPNFNCSKREKEEESERGKVIPQNYEVFVRE
jgi:hypothetical protein